MKLLHSSVVVRSTQVREEKLLNLALLLRERATLRTTVSGWLAAGRNVGRDE